ncbi:AMP-binding protein [Schleiferia thermophila]|uniref:Acyl-CoA synthetase (AMP-forming)/AMP-acid ligase II n=1 Tax=Schleiferia thermophila TaxID=884107 RepID=A0A369A8Q1_9FLAO|nr:AMP-binding protein [Schleiferia thermophila]RCX05699.1 acyl-CoA synthetase (AMP-forming)/AMP-acid ligase II [Schleiferia thermophila]GCD78812.1 hypothetical protein JCM30197_00590 [Schleiferia thermophila]
MFLIDVKNNQHYSWEGLVEEINKNNRYYPIGIFENLYQYLHNIIVAVLANKNVTLVDYTFKKEEIERILGDDVILLNKAEDVEIPWILNKEDLIEKIKSRRNWSITLFTSGTTGLPKKVTHNYESIGKGLVINEKHSKDVWGFAYNITHIAGLQVYFQALFNKNTLINLFDVERELVFDAINKYKITHISATPTFYRLLQPFENRVNQTIKRITLGGEKSDKKLIENLSKCFVNAKIKNTYATTEFGTILITHDGENFSIPEKYKNKIKIVDNEIVVHRSLLGMVDLDVEEWYYTGDRVEIIQHDPLNFKIMGRTSDFVNVGGYKVNLLEVEEVLRNIDVIKNAKVYSKQNSIIGNIICADVILLKDKKCTESEIRKILKDHLQEYKIPRVIRMVEKLDVTRSGKLKSQS